MRLIASSQLQSGMITGYPVFPPAETRGIPLLAAGVQLSDKVIRRLIEAGITNIFIEDDLSSGIENTDIGDPDVRRAVIAAVETVFQHVSSGHHSLDPDDVSVLEHAVSDVITDLMDLRHSLVCTTDLLIHGMTRSHRAVSACIMACNTARTYFNQHGWLDFRGNLREDHIPERVQKLGMGILLADIGLTALPGALTDKPVYKLTSDERQQWQQHPVIGLQLMAHTELSPLTKLVIAQHHERYDGTGFPRGLTAQETHINGHIASVVNAYLDLIDEDVAGNSVADPIDAWNQLTTGSIGLHHPDVIAAFCESVAPYGPGVAVRLSDGRSGIVSVVSPSHPVSPVVRVTHAPNEQILATPFEELDLTQHPRLEILGQLPALPSDTAQAFAAGR